MNTKPLLWIVIGIIVVGIIFVGVWVLLNSEKRELTGEDICLKDIYNCGDFATQSKAQDIFEQCGGVENDVHGLDKDKNGLACEGLS